MNTALLSSYFVVSLLLISNWYIAYTPPRPITCMQIVFHPGVFNISQSTLNFNKHAICSAPKKCMSGHFLYLFSLLLLNASDCHPNPGPRTVRFPCGECGRACTWSRTVRSIHCTNCEKWFHKQCLQMSTHIYNALDGTDITWHCCQCGIPNFNSSLFMDFEASMSSCSTPFSTSFSSNNSSVFGSPQHASSPRASRRKQPTAKRKLRTLIINFQSMRAKREAFWALLEQSDPDIILATETWLTPCIAEREVLPDNYRFVSRRDRPNPMVVLQ